MWTCETIVKYIQVGATETSDLETILTSVLNSMGGTCWEKHVRINKLW